MVSHGQTTVGQIDSQKLRIAKPMVLRITAKRKGDTDLTILWFKDILLGMEIDQIGGSLLLSLSLLAALTYGFVALLGGRAI